jgi:hypothetical protein
MQTTSYRESDNAPSFVGWRQRRLWQFRQPLLQALMWTRSVEVGNILLENSMEARFALDEHVIEAFTRGALIGIRNTSMPVLAAAAWKCAAYVASFVAQHVLWRFTTWCCLAQLLCDPFYLWANMGG